MIETAAIHIKITDLAIGYRQGEKLKEIKNSLNLSAIPGELVALIGSNGIGKSTLLRSLCGFQEILKGKICFNDQPLNYYKHRDLAKIMSYVSTEVVRVQNLRVRDLLALARFPYTNFMGTLTDADLLAVDKAIDLVGLRGYENRVIDELSDGERQRAMIARSLVQDTPVIILDEPTAFLDIRNKYEIIHLLHNFARNENKTIVFSTHDLNIATSEVDKIWLMLENEVLEGAPEDLILQGHYNKVFASENILFDEYSGDFRLKKTFQGSFSVDGPDLAKRWTIHALARAGFIYVNEAENAEIQVSVSELQEWKLKNRGSDPLNYKSVYELVRHLMNR
ncbi:MAG: hypothetical protein A2W90_17165 [Bacteroidetes bacterium GWF2_42_66]|nr:MAG: hypothetical protein A2W92_19095 [Bacteroidetes bacterium GWA2_42_15]OFY03004.1 MAG: hypothetical protein A2W89_04490 [Bacteroidetes bacterium GWE2_42_39]OFY43257.1 MAG: hypothetical protein A2W90_17165 [Bacteroidetes bacterium GWF2_42_66]HAZ04559.1 iron ABC transporter ATP-binding protein [Marinilabiliales bacterium]HBL77286.1 iron ABC transporter ATP-binding protein [Prolixibacteraceae bacterium]